MPSTSPQEVWLLTPRELEVLRESWKRMVAQGQQQLANKLLKWMFQNVSGMVEQFSKFKSKGHDHLDMMPEFNAHAQAVVMTIEATIFIDQPERMDRKITDLIRSHINRKDSPAGPRLFEQLRDKIHIFIEQERDVPPGNEEPQLWTKFFTVIVNIGRREDRNQSRGCVLCRSCWCPTT